MVFPASWFINAVIERSAQRETGQRCAGDDANDPASEGEALNKRCIKEWAPR